MTKEEIFNESIEKVKAKSELLTKELGIKVYGFAIITEDLSIKEGYFKMPTRYAKSIVLDLYHGQRVSEAHDLILRDFCLKEYSCPEIYNDIQTEENDLIYFGFQRAMSNLVSMYSAIDETLKKK